LLAPTADTSLWDLQPGANNGAAPEMSCGATGAPDAGNLAGSACLFQFDLSSIPNDATVTAAMLTLCTTKQDGCCASSFDAFALLVPWREMEASWIDRQTGKQWAVSGAQGSLDREAAPSTAGSVAMWYPPPAGCFKFVITGLAQRWVAGTLPNNGVKVQATSGSGAMSVGVASLQYAPDAGSTASRPELLVDWTQP
jgi:hypothetical protein